MAQVIVRENESLESALKRFKRSCARDGVKRSLRLPVRKLVSINNENGDANQLLPVRIFLNRIEEGDT